MRTAAPVGVFLLGIDGQEEVINVKLDVEHLFLTHVQLRDRDQGSVAHKSSNDDFEVGLRQSCKDVDRLNCDVEPGVHCSHQEGCDGVREGCWVESNLSHHVNTVSYVVHAHLVDYHVHKEVCRLNLELCVHKMSSSAISSVLTIKQNQEC